MHITPAKSTCIKLRNAMLKYGVDQFFWEWIEEIDVTAMSTAEAKRKLIEREQYYLDSWKPFGERGYNLATVAGSNLGIKYKHTNPKRPYNHSAEWLEKMSGVNSKRNIAVSQFTTDGQLLATYPSTSLASKAVPKATIQAIIKCCAGMQKTAGGFLWSRSSTRIQLPLPHKSKAVQMLDSNGTVLHTFTNAKVAAMYLNKSVNPIYKCVRGEQTTAHGFWWRNIVD